jgi:hypothetical protein
MNTKDFSDQRKIDAFNEMVDAAFKKRFPDSEPTEQELQDFFDSMVKVVKPNRRSRRGSR